MTVEEFAEKNKTTEQIVLNWIKEKYIPGVVDNGGVYFIPLSARRPYTRRRAKTGTAIMKSIIKACDKRYGISAELYGISEPEFQDYITTLEKKRYISSYKEDGITYYNATLDGKKCITETSTAKNLINLGNVVASALS